MSLRFALFAALWGLSATLISTPLSAAEDNIDRLTEKLIDLRSEVESLNSELLLQREEYTQRMKFLYQQKGELESDIKRERLTIGKLEQELEKNRAQVRELGADSRIYLPVLEQAMAELQRYIETSMPFKRPERLAELKELRTQLEGDLVEPQRVANRLWAFFEDELRLTRESGIYRQVITLNGEQTLVDVARVGMVMMFFRTSDGQLGALQQSAGEWRYTTFNDSAESEQVAALFDSFGKQIRVGYFQLPNALIAQFAQ